MAHLYVIAGHGAGDSGAVGNGYTEAERVRALAKRIKALGGDNVTLGDVNRNYYADNGISKLSIPKDWCIIELHMDSSTSASARGGHVIINGSYDPDSYDLALASFVGAMFPGRANKIVGRNDLANPKRAAAKGLNYRLVEFGFVTNVTDVSILNSRMDEIAQGVLSAFGIITSTDKWIMDEIGWWYRYANGTYPKSQWLLLDCYYYFNEKGYALANEWLSYDGNWYWLKSDCRMVTGWQYIDEHWYYLNPTGTKNKPVGAMLTGWQFIDGQWYYLRTKAEGKHPHGSMVEGSVTVDDYDYYCRVAEENKSYPTGSMLTGWHKVVDEQNKTKWFWYNKDVNCQPIGSMLKNHWLTTEDGKKYYLKNNGEMACNETIEVSGKQYSFDENGALER